MTLVNILKLLIDWFTRLGNWLRIATVIVTIILSALASILATTAISQVPESGVTNPLVPQQVIQVAPASGVEGFSVELFCADPLTKVERLPAPDASGISYQLTRVRDSKSEMVLVVLDSEAKVNQEFSRHFYDTTLGQQSEPAFVNSNARKCIEGGAK